MRHERPESRPANLELWAGAALLVLFLLLCVERYVQQQGRSVVPEVNLLEELSRAEFIEDEPLPADADWPQWRGLRRDGVAPGEGLLTTWPSDGPPRLWEASVGPAYSSFAIAGGRAYTLQRDGDREELLCFDAAAGKLLWSEGYHQPIPKGTSIAYGEHPRSTPTVADGLVYSVGILGRFQCRDALSGELKWEHGLLDKYGAPVLQWGTSFSPLVEGDLVITTPGGPGASVAFDRRTGREVWKALSDKAGYSSPIAVTLDGERLVIVFTGEAVVGLTAAEGRPCFRYPWATTADVNAATPIAFRTRVGDVERLYLFITSGYNKGCGLFNIRGKADDYRVKLVYASDRMCCHFSTPVRSGDHVYGFNETQLTCLDLRTGKVRWKESGFRKGSLIRAGGSLIVLGEEGRLALVEANPEKFHELATARVFSSRCWTLPAMAQGRLFLRDEEKAVCLKLGK
jgi:outer membrane protein assembly factor BamB